MSIAHAGEVRLGAAVLDKPVFFVLDLGGRFGDVEGIDEDGLVGFEMFRRFRVTIDYAAHELVLTDPSRFTPPTGAHAIPFELADRIPIVQATLDGLPVSLSVDTGSRSSLTLHSPFVREHDLAARYHAAPETITGWGVGGPARGRPARLGVLTLGDLEITDIAGDLYTGDKGAFASPSLSGNLGAGVLRRYTVTFDYDAKRMWLVPNADAGKPDAFDRSGLWLFRAGDALEVNGIAPDSAAARAGVEQGDRTVLRIGERGVVATRSLSEWRTRLRELPAGTRLPLVIERAKAKRDLQLVLADQIPAHANLATR